MNTRPPRLLANPVLGHPLMGANIRTILSLVRRSGGLDSAGWAKVSLFLASAVMRAPASAAESAVVRLLAKPRASLPPLFIVGHWRSGTTLLHNLLRGGPFSTAFVWTKSADEILDSVARFCRRTSGTGH